MIVRGQIFRRVVAVLLVCTTFITCVYAGLSVYIAAQLVYVPPTPLYATPASMGMAYQNVSFPGRVDNVRLQGWYIPGVLPNGQLTTQRTIIFVHGNRTNRADKGAGLLALSVDLARNGFGVLAFDMRGFGQSPPAPLSLGYFEQRDVLGAVDFLQNGPLPYPQLGRPHVLLGWGISMGAATLLLAAAQAPAIKAIVSDSAYATIIPVLEREIPRLGHIPAFFTPGALEAGNALYGINYYAVRPIDAVAAIAPRPIFFIHGLADTYIPLSNFAQLVAAAHAAHDPDVQTWLVPKATHARAFIVEGQAYVTRIVAFYNQAVGLDTSEQGNRKELPLQ